MIVALQGGLGNQMFQYAFGISVAHEREEPLFFTRDRLDKDPKPMRHYQLDVAYGLDLKFKDSLEEPIFTENPFCYNPAVYEQPPGTSFLGHWQTEKYFDHALVRNALYKPFGRPDNETLVMAGRILDCQSAFVGVRRGDYVHDENQKNFHGLMPMSYHLEGMNIIKKEHPKVRFFIFSDDPDWCEQSFQDCTVVRGNEFTPWWNIWLMSLCKHAVIANSTFHWWGAWLGDMQKKRIVVAPKRWFLVDLESKDICPERWLLL